MRGLETGIPCTRPLPVPSSERVAVSSAAISVPTRTVKVVTCALNRATFGVQIGDDPFLLLDRLVVCNDQTKQCLATGVLEINHAASISPPFIPEQIRNTCIR